MQGMTQIKEQFDDDSNDSLSSPDNPNYVDESGAFNHINRAKLDEIDEEKDTQVFNGLYYRPLDMLTFTSRERIDKGGFGAVDIVTI